MQSKKTAALIRKKTIYLKKNYIFLHRPSLPVNGSSIHIHHTDTYTKIFKEGGRRPEYTDQNSNGKKERNSSNKSVASAKTDTKTFQFY